MRLGILKGSGRSLPLSRRPRGFPAQAINKIIKIPRPLAAGIFIPANVNTVHLAVLFLAISAFAQIFDSIRNILTGSLRGFRDTKVPMWVGILSTWVFYIPVSYLLGFVFHWGAVGVAMGFLVGVFVGSIILIKRFYNKTQTTVQLKS